MAVLIWRRVVPAIGVAARVAHCWPRNARRKSPTDEGRDRPWNLNFGELGLHVGDRASVIASGKRSTMTIVGRAVSPHFGLGSFTATDLGQGALLTAASLPASEGTAPQIALMRFASGAHHDQDSAATRRSLAGYCRTVDQSTCYLMDDRPSDVSNLVRVVRVPLVLAGLLALVGVALLTQLVALLTRRRRRDLAILKSLGMLRRRRWPSLAGRLRRWPFWHL